jgi:hypothetical protein
MARGFLGLLAAIFQHWLILEALPKTRLPFPAA